MCADLTSSNGVSRALSVEVYVPRDFAPASNDPLQIPEIVAGYKLHHAYVVVAALTPDQFTQISVPGLQVIGTIDGKMPDAHSEKTTPKFTSSSILAGQDLSHEVSATQTQHEEPENVPEIGLLRFAFDPKRRFPVVTLPFKILCFIIMFDPPKYLNWEHFSLYPILLQSPLESPQSKHSLDASVVAAHMNYMAHPDSCTLLASSGEVLDKLNLLRQVRDGINRSLGRPHLLKEIRYVVDAFRFVGAFVARLFKCIHALAIISGALWLLNYKINNKSLCDMSHLAQLCDMRLRQLAFLPLQFHAYRGNSKISHTESLVSTEYPSLNVNNSHYINMHNSLWLICNDMILGVACRRLIVDNYEAGIELARRIFVQRWAISDLFRLISWISVDNPAGFKLNRELGKFSGDLYVWALRFWKYILSDSFDITFPGLAADKQASFAARVFVLLGRYALFVVLCGGGLSFFLALLQDILIVTTFHIECFYRTSTRLYHLQLEVLQLLLQLLRGKKYNVLRNRIDNLNNYSRDSRADSFEIDQLLLGTLVFMVLLLLLPTVLAFYVTFYLLKLAILIVLATLETGIIVLNLTPLFVVLLKCKNSRRLQGGIRFVHVSSQGNTNYMLLSNQALTYREIFRPFFLLFSSAAHLRSTAASRFFHGEFICLDSDYVLKRRYLMLPQDPES